MASTSAEEQQQVPEEREEELAADEDGEPLEPGSQEEAAAEAEAAAAPPSELLATQAAGLGADLLATQVMAPMDASDDLLATQVMAPMPDLLATQVMAHADDPADLLATQVMAPMLDSSDLLATQVMAPMDEDLLATQVMRPVDAPPHEEKQVEYARPTELRQVKRPKAAYWLFQEAVRSQVAAELGPGTGGAKVTAELAARWKAMEEAEKAKYVEKAKELRAQYDKEIADGAIPAVSAAKARAARVAAKKAAAAGKKGKAGKKALENLKRRAGPKRPKCSYSIWLSEHRKEVKAKLVAEGAAAPSFEEIARAAGKTWSALSAEEKAPYVERAQQLAAKFKDISKACKEYRKADAKDARAKAAKKKKQEAAKAKKQAAKAASKAKKAAADKAKKQKPESAEGSAAGSPKTTPKKAKKQPKTQEAGAKAQETPKKRAAAAAGPTPPKKARKSAAAEASAYLDMGLVAEAEKAGFGGTFKTLAGREDMKPYAQRALLDALVANGGLLHRAKDAVLASQA